MTEKSKENPTIRKSPSPDSVKKLSESHKTFAELPSISKKLIIDRELVHQMVNDYYDDLKKLYDEKTVNMCNKTIRPRYVIEKKLMSSTFINNNNTPF